MTATSRNPVTTSALPENDHSNLPMINLRQG
jgi:hypothetical protein